MKSRDLPKDIVWYIQKKIIRTVMIFLFLGCISVSIGIFSWAYLSRTNMFFHISVLLLLGSAPFWLSGFPCKLMDASWHGTVTEIYVKEETGTYMAGGGQLFPYDKHVIYLKVKTDRGKEKHVVAREFGVRSHAGHPVPNEGDITLHLNEYTPGDHVYHFYGLRHCYIVKKNSDMTDCVICSSQNAKDRDVCLNCGHSLIQGL